MTLSTATAEDSRLWLATLVSNDRITAPQSPEDVRRLRFAIDASFDGRVGQCLRVRAPGQFGQRYHERLYSIADLEPSLGGRMGFDLLVRRCHVIDDFNGERYDGVASNHLCNLPLGGRDRVHRAASAIPSRSRKTARRRAADDRHGHGRRAVPRAGAPHL